MSKIVRSKIIPLENINFIINQTKEELKELVKNSTNIPIVSVDIKDCCDKNLPIEWNEETVIGIIADKDNWVNEPSIENDCIYGDILFYNDSDVEKQWKNASITVDNDKNVISLDCIEYR